MTRLLPLLPLLAGAALAQPARLDTTITLQQDGQLVRERVAGEVATLRLQNDHARVEAGATYRALRLRLAWQGASGTIRLRATVPAELRRLLSTPSSVQPR